MPLVLMGSMFMINTNADILMLGTMVGAPEAGVYKVATRGAELLTFSIAIFSTPLGPVIAHLHGSGKHQELQQIVRRVAWLAFLPTAILGGFFFWKGDLFLQIFGSEFADYKAHVSLVILCMGQVILAASGPVSLLLVMTGMERYTAIAISFGALLNLALNAILIPMIGAIGAACATALSTAILALMLVYFSIVKLQINPSIIAKS